MAKICIVTDSTASLPSNIVAEYNLKVVPLRVSIGKDSYRDGVDITPTQVLEKMRGSQELPKTSQPAIGDFATLFEELGPQCDSIVVPLISSKLSGTYSSAKTAAEMYPQYKISVIDTYSTFMGLGFAAMRAAEAAGGGASHEEVVKVVEEVSARMQIVLVVDTLEYLHKGGRIGGAAAFVGGMLNVKPLLQLKDGLLERLQQVRTKKKANERMAEIIAERMAGKKAHISLGYAGNKEEIEQVAADLKPKVDLVEYVQFEVGPTITVHTGPGVVGSAFYGD